MLNYSVAELRVNKKIGVSLYKTKIDDEKCGCIVNGNPFRGM
mgnify:CR=1 FL=1